MLKLSPAMAMHVFLERLTNAASSRTLNAIHFPLYAYLRRCGCWPVVERDILRSRLIRPQQRTVIVEPHTVAERRWEILVALRRKQVRTVCYHRLQQGRGHEPITALIWSRLLPGLREVEIDCSDIGPGFVLTHGYGSVIAAERIGSDCTISQQVTLGRKNGRYPTLGDRAWVFPGAIIVGDVTVADDATVGAGALVLEDVASAETVAGIPARPLYTGSDGLGHFRI